MTPAEIWGVQRAVELLLAEQREKCIAGAKLIAQAQIERYVEDDEKQARMVLMYVRDAFGNPDHPLSREASK